MFAVLNRAETMLKRCAKSADAKFTKNQFPTIDMVRVMAVLLTHKKCVMSGSDELSLCSKNWVRARS